MTDTTTATKPYFLDVEENPTNEAFNDVLSAVAGLDDSEVISGVLSLLSVVSGLIVVAQALAVEGMSEDGPKYGISPTEATAATAVVQHYENEFLAPRINSLFAAAEDAHERVVLDGIVEDMLDNIVGTVATD